MLLLPTSSSAVGLTAPHHVEEHRAGRRDDVAPAAPWEARGQDYCALGRHDRQHGLR